MMDKLIHVKLEPAKTFVSELIARELKKKYMVIIYLSLINFPIILQYLTLLKNRLLKCYKK